MRPGHKAILDAFLSLYVPADSYDGDLDHVFTTEQIVADFGDMADWDTNEVADYIAEAGFKVRTPLIGIPHGWIFRVKQDM